MNELKRQSLVRNDNIFFSVQTTSSCVLTFLLIFIIILGDPGADSGGERKSKQAENMAQKKSEERQEEPLGTMSYQTSSKRSPPFWLLIGGRKLDAQIDEDCRQTISYLKAYSYLKLYCKKQSNQKLTANTVGTLEEQF